MVTRWRLALSVAATVTVVMLVHCGRCASAVSSSELTALTDFNLAAGFPAALSDWTSGDPCLDGWNGVDCSSAPVAITYGRHDISLRVPVSGVRVLRAGRNVSLGGSHRHDWPAVTTMTAVSTLRSDGVV